MIIHYRGLYPDRFDTPYGIGTLIFAQNCHHHCKGCFHQDKYTLPILEEDSKYIIKKILEDPFSRGIVLGGFEWTEQYDELLAIIEEARANKLEVILYTYHTIEDIERDYSELLTYKGIYLKCGEYDINKLSTNYSSLGVPLASTNQKIYKI